MKATFENTVDILVKAYLNDTLEHNNCYACAVGNLVAAANGYTYTKCIDRTSRRFALTQNGGRYYGFSGSGNGGAWYDLVDELMLGYAADNNTGLHEIKSTGYSVEEVLKIERAFERANRGLDEEEYMFNGLMAVVDVLADIHGIDLKQKEEAKLMFIKS